MKPTLLLDIDGTIVPFGFTHHEDNKLDVIPTEPYIKQQVKIHHWYVDVCITHRHIEMVERLREHFDIKWFTGWDHHAEQIEHFFGGPFEVIRTHTRLKGGPRKHEALEWWLEDNPDAAFVWIDDDEVKSFPLSVIPEGSMTILVQDPKVGMTEADVETAIAWAQARG